MERVNAGRRLARAAGDGRSGFVPACAGPFDPSGRGSPISELPAAWSSPERGWRLHLSDLLAIFAIGLLFGLAISEWWPDRASGRLASVAGLCEAAVR